MKRDMREWGGVGFVLSCAFLFLTYELKKRHNKQHHCALAILPSVTDAHSSVEYHSVLASQTAHCTASITRERHLFKTIDSIYDSKRPTSHELLEHIKSRSLLPWIKLSKSVISRSLWRSQVKEIYKLRLKGLLSLANI